MFFFTVLRLRAKTPNLKPSHQPFTMGVESLGGGASVAERQELFIIDQLESSLHWHSLAVHYLEQCESDLEWSSKQDILVVVVVVVCQ